MARRLGTPFRNYRRASLWLLRQGKQRAQRGEASTHKNCLERNTGKEIYPRYSAIHDPAAIRNPRTVFGPDPGFTGWIGPTGPKATEMLAKPPASSFTRRVRQNLAT